MQKQIIRFLCALTVVALAAGAISSNAALARNRHNGDEFNRRGNILIADQFNNRAIEVTHERIVRNIWVGVAIARSGQHRTAT